MPVVLCRALMCKATLDLLFLPDVKTSLRPTAAALCSQGRRGIILWERGGEGGRGMWVAEQGGMWGWQWCVWWLKCYEGVLRVGGIGWGVSWWGAGWVVGGGGADGAGGGDAGDNVLWLLPSTHLT
jgi:hypothetical protein